MRGQRLLNYSHNSHVAEAMEFWPYMQLRYDRFYDGDVVDWVEENFGLEAATFDDFRKGNARWYSMPLRNSFIMNEDIVVFFSTAAEATYMMVTWK